MSRHDYMGRLAAALLDSPVVASVAFYQPKSFEACRWIAHAVAWDHRGGVRRTFACSLTLTADELRMANPERDAADAIHDLERQVREEERSQ